jgi:mucin-19
MNMNLMLNIRFKALTLAVLIGLIANALWTVPAFADSGTTNPSPPASGSGSTRGAHSSSNNLSNVPSGTKVVIVDSNGNKVPLGSQQAQDILDNGDPVWCPATLAAPTPGTGGCTTPGAGDTNYIPTDLSSLVTYLGNNQGMFGMNGTIWIEGGSNTTSSSITMDGSTTFSTMANFTLTLKGGWNGTSGSSITSSLNPSTFTVPISITNWNNSVTLSDIVVSNPTGDGLTISSSKNITLTRVQANDNLGYGLSVNSNGAITVTDLTASGNGADGADLNNNTSAVGGVTLNGVNIFDGNSNSGLIVNSLGAIKANSLIAYGNGIITGDGVDLDNHYGATPLITQTVALTGSSQFKNNTGNGLSVSSNALITANNITAISNGADGADLINNYPSVAAGVTLTGTNTFNSNKYNGLNVASYGAILLNSITANNNSNSSGKYGADINTTGGTSISNVTLTGTNTFNGNYDDGLFIDSAGAVTASSVTANNDQSASGADITAIGAVTISGLNTFNSNAVNGLSVLSQGVITTNNLTANENGKGGVTLDNCGNINIGSGCTTLTSKSIAVKGFNTFNSNVNDGLDIFSKGAITTSNLNANCNGFDSGCSSLGAGYGVQIDNCQLNIVPACTGSGTVIISGTNILNDNYGGGLLVNSNGAITLNSITASFNAKGYGISVKSTDSSAPQAITLTGTNVFNNNFDDGADLNANGKITVSSVAANWNGTSGTTGIGLALSNQTGTTAAAITISGTNVFTGNYSSGLEIEATGTITASTITSNGTINSAGVVLKNTWLTGSSSGVSMANINASNNNLDGLDVTSNGVITGSGLTANGNGNSTFGYGADIQDTGTIKPSLTLNGTNTFNNNHAGGLEIVDLGAVTVSNLQASNNIHGYGASITTGSATVASAVTLSGASVFNGNYGDGLDVSTYGAITTTNLTADGNTNGTTGYGVSLNNSLAVTPQKITMTGTNTFNNNYSDGLHVQSIGAISLSSVIANNSSHGNGVSLTNTGSGAVGGVALTGYNTFSGNYDNGLTINTKGAITASSLNANSNGNSDIAGSDDGVYLDAASAAITLTGINFFNNNGDNSGTPVGDGLDINSAGIVTLTYINANTNAQDGFGAVTTGNMKVTCGSLTGNGQYGANLNVTGTTLTLIGVVASGNGPLSSSPQFNSTGITPVTTRDCTLP